jgi:hypothetical protein
VPDPLKIGTLTLTHTVASGGGKIAPLDVYAFSVSAEVPITSSGGTKTAGKMQLSALSVTVKNTSDLAPFVSFDTGTPANPSLGRLQLTLDSEQGATVLDVPNPVISTFAYVPQASATAPELVRVGFFMGSLTLTLGGVSAGWSLLTNSAINPPSCAQTSDWTFLLDPAPVQAAPASSVPFSRGSFSGGVPASISGSAIQLGPQYYDESLLEGRTTGATPCFFAELAAGRHEATVSITRQIKSTPVSATKLSTVLFSKLALESNRDGTVQQQVSLAFAKADATSP